MRTLVGKLVVVGGVSVSTLLFGLLGTASAACDPGLGSVLCPPPEMPAPPAPAPPPPPDAPAPAPAPSPAPAPQPAPASAPRSAAEAKARLLTLINEDRAEAGLAALATRGDLDDLAADHSTDMAAARRIFHNDALFTGATKQRIGAKTVGENVASNSSVDDAHRRLLASPGHRANLLSPSFTRLGLGLVDADGTWYLTEVFVTPVASAAPPAVTAPPVAAAGAAVRSTTRSTTPRAARGARPVLSTTTEAPSTEPTPETAVAIETDVPDEGRSVAPISAIAPKPANGSMPFAPLALVALALVLGTGLVGTRVAYRKWANGSILDAQQRRNEETTWHPFSWSTISPMSGN